MPTAGADELLHGERGDLGEVRHRRLAAVVLPVRVGDERRRGVEAERRRHRAEVLRVERQRSLDPHDQVGDGRSRRAEKMTSEPA